MPDVIPVMDLEEAMNVNKGTLKMMTVEQFVKAITTTAETFKSQEGMTLGIPLDTTVVFIVTAGEKRFGVEVVVGEKFLAEQGETTMSLSAK